MDPNRIPTPDTLNRLLSISPITVACLVLCLGVLMTVFARVVAGSNVNKIAVFSPAC